MRHLVLMLLCAFAPVAASAAEGPQSINIHADCDGKIPSAVVASFTEAIRASQKYHLVPNFSDEGRQGIVMTVHMACAEMHDVVGIATSYGWAKCYSEKECHIAGAGPPLSRHGPGCPTFRDFRKVGTTTAGARFTRHIQQPAFCARRLAWPPDSAVTTGLDIRISSPRAVTSAARCSAANAIAICSLKCWSRFGGATTLWSSATS